KIPPLFGSFANAIGPSDVDSHVTGPELAELVKSSSERVAKSAEFEEVRTKLAEARSHEGIVRLADIIKEQREESKASDAKSKGANGNAKDGAKNGNPKQAKAESEPHDPQVEEAVEVLADLVALSHRPPGAEAVARGGHS